MTGSIPIGDVLGRPTPGPTCPVAHPLGSPHGCPEPVAKRTPGRIAGTDTPRSSSSPPVPARPTRIGSRTRQRLAKEISGRDRDILGRLWEHRYLTTKHIEAFSFTDHASVDAAARTTRRVLARLERDGLVRSLARRVGGVRAGSEARVWQLSPAGVRIARPEVGRGWRTHEPSERFLAHTLAIADVHMAALAGRDRAGVRGVVVQVEPASWRRFSGIGGQGRLIRPDLAASIHGDDHEGGFVDRWFIEVDLGSESLPTLLNKCRLYMDYYRSGIEQATDGAFPQVLWVLHGHRADERARLLAHRILRTPSLEPRLFIVTTAERLEEALWGEPSTTADISTNRKEEA